MKKARLFQYAILWHPTEEQAEDGKKTKILRDPETILASGPDVAQMIAIRAIPEDYQQELEQVEVVLRPF